ncbi:D-alanine--D-alanine ligase [Sedimentibacter hydroxybenzoicus DSM 7310]|uniref:D-alanine--D-alanine ligase n=1 Tax=Sedimentibacter hydroxybenzoicus DSM 7310 TaxID=1123245 RepID=A0A974BKP3_SEDHY|nr:D-alanine--D-alanine ligase family protein [Sedimentibacter hydroxybenzoicus]NYB75089.1 D-alanine--D-alanine ligase [Sedimentibacter hydroxybenzoicus DSM 7310]
MKSKLAILFGGKSDEYSVSLHSAAAIINNVPEELFDTIFIGITQEGKWLLYEGSADKINDDTWHKEKLSPVLLNMGDDFKGFIKLNEKDNTFERIEIDCIFPVLHGRNGEDGTIQGLCQMTDIPFVGCDMTSSAVCMDKEFTHIICEAAGIKTAPYVAATNSSKLNIKNLYDEVVEKFSIPIFIKPANNGSSIGISKIRNYDEFERGIMEAFQFDNKVVIEKGIDGFEIGCAVVGNEDLIIGEVDEIETKNDFFDYVEKYSQHNSKIHCPARISDELKVKAKIIAEKTYKALGCKGLARVDMFVTTDNRIILNEINTIPGLTDLSRYPSMLRKIGIEYKDLIVKLVELALELN